MYNARAFSDELNHNELANKPSIYWTGPLNYRAEPSFVSLLITFPLFFFIKSCAKDILHPSMVGVHSFLLQARYFFSFCPNYNLNIVYAENGLGFCYKFFMLRGINNPLWFNLHVRHTISAGWLKWRQASSVLCDKKMPQKLKGKFYRMVICPTMLYGAECWPTKRRHVQQLSVAEMRMLRWFCGHTRRDRVRNEDIRDRVGVAPIEEKLVCETWVPLDPHRPGSRPSPTSGSGLLEDLPTCQWAQPI
jgi:hypothetical protein